jgi:elongation factor P
MATTSDLKRGMRVELDGDPWTVLDHTTQTPSARGSATLVKVKLRNIRTRQLVDRTFKAGETIKLPDFEIRPSQYLYDDGSGLHYFMDDESYEQFPLSAEEIESELGYLRPNDSVRALFFDGKCIGIEVPNTVVLEVVDCDPGMRGDTVTNVTKPARLETGLEVQVPLFIEVGDKLVIDTRDARYVRRA